MSRDYIKNGIDRYYMDQDIKPKSAAKRHIHQSARESAKQEIREQLKELEDQDRLDLDDMLNSEADISWYCYMFGKEMCPVCRERGNTEDD